MKRKILIVDDMESLLSLYKTQIRLKFPGVEVLTATNALDALAQLSMEVDGDELIGVVSDYDMDLVNGFQFARKVRKSFPLLPIFIHTQSATDDLLALQEKCDSINVSVFSKKDSMKAYILPWIEDELVRFVADKLVFVATLIR